MTKRQERIEMTRIRMDTISKAAPYYSRLAVYNCWNLASLLGPENETRDFELMFYYLCNILYLRHKIIQTFGEIQLDNLEAEGIIGDLLRAINNLVTNGLGRLEASRIEYLVENDTPFHAFHDTLQRAENTDLYN
ncbi:MAG: hypothetical protein WAZ77_11750 [Candidatus Nitrosopolaris sp.]|jgi:hypothetical protein